MSTENPDNISTPKTNESQAVFAPLGKYAVVAIIMVSIIVTTAIMLDKQLNTAEQQVAAIENKVAKSQAAELTAGDIAPTDASQPAAVSAENSAKIVETETDETVAKETQTTTYVTKAEVAAIDAQSSKTTTAVMPAATTSAVKSKAAAVTTPAIINKESVVAEAMKPAAATSPAPAAIQAKPVTTEQDALAQATKTESATGKFDIENQERIAAFKAEQKQRLSDMLTRIKELDAQRLDQFKAHQDEQIEHLRKQVAQQQQMIDDLIVRNKDLFELRAARLQRHQSNREQMLNRI